MSSPALYWNNRTVTLDKNGILSSAKKVMQSKGLTNIKIGTSVVSGRTDTVHALMAVVKKKDPVSPGFGLGTDNPPTFIVFFSAAGQGAKDVLAGLVKKWDSLSFL